jgi:hypothetical protein
MFPYLPPLGTALGEYKRRRGDSPTRHTIMEKKKRRGTPPFTAILVE